MKKRIFVAIEISPNAGNRVAEYINFLRKEFKDLRVGWINEEKIHLTLKFLGDLEPVQLRDLINAVDKTSEGVSDFSFQISGTGVFPNPKRARILWLGIEESLGVLERLNMALNIECEKIGFEREKKKFKPHLTIGRIRERGRARGLIREHLETNFEPVGVRVRGISIFESQIRPTGSVYFLMHRSEFRGK